MVAFENKGDTNNRMKNWEEIARILKRLSKKLNLTITDVNLLVENKNNEVLSFLVHLYEKINNRRLKFKKNSH